MTVTVDSTLVFSSLPAFAIVQVQVRLQTTRLYQPPPVARGYFRRSAQAEVRWIPAPTGFSSVAAQAVLTQVRTGNVASRTLARPRRRRLHPAMAICIGMTILFAIGFVFLCRHNTVPGIPV